MVDSQSVDRFAKTLFREALMDIESPHKTNVKNQLFDQQILLIVFIGIYKYFLWARLSIVGLLFD